MHQIFKQVASIHLKDGHELITTKDWQSALLEFEKAYNLDNSLLEALFYIGFVKSEIGLTNEAMEIFLKVLNIDPNHVAALINMSYCLFKLKRNENALVYINKAIDINPDWWCYLIGSDIKKALSDIEGSIINKESDKMDRNFCLF